jgi:hypothetical protein
MASLIKERRRGVDVQTARDQRSATAEPVAVRQGPKKKTVEEEEGKKKHGQQ